MTTRGVYTESRPPITCEFEQSPPPSLLNTNRVQTIVPTPGSSEPCVCSSFESKTGTWQYVVADLSTKKAVIIDSVLDYEPASHVITTETADALLKLVAEKGYQIEMILETHAHADHLTAASYLQGRLGQLTGKRPPIGIGKRIVQVQQTFGERYGIPEEEYKDVFDHLFEDNETFSIGTLKATVLHLPGHTPDHVGYLVGNNVFCGDSVFNADIGTARTDFPGGSAKALFESTQKLMQLPDHFKVWTGHDYPSEDRGAPVPWMRVRDQREQNQYLAEGLPEEAFISQRKKRDATLAAPRLLHPSLQVNIRAGRLPRPTPWGQRILHLPLSIDEAKWPSGREGEAAPLPSNPTPGKAPFSF